MSRESRFDRSLPVIVGALVAPMFLGASAIAQDDHRSHAPIPLPADVSWDRLFQERLQQARLPIDLSAIVKQFGPNGPNAEQVNKIIRANPLIQDLINNPEKAGQYHDLLDKALRIAPPPPGISPEVIQRHLENLQRSQATPLVAQPARPQPRANDRPSSDPAEQARKNEVASQVAQWAERFPRDRLPESIRNSPAVQHLFQSISDSALNAMGSNGTDGWEAQLARLETQWQAAREWLPKEVPPALRRLKLPDLSRYSPNVPIPQFEANGPRMPSVDLSEASLDYHRAANVMLGVLGGSIVAVVLWRLSGVRLAPAGSSAGALGPWPLDPAQVATRADVIQAFEYLSVLRCGESARSWHHWAIAECLGRGESDRRAAAISLAHLYERARYAPTTAEEPNWAIAREPLTLLSQAG